MTLLILMLNILLLMRVLRSFDGFRKNTFVHPNDNIEYQNENHEHPNVNIEYQNVRIDYPNVQIEHQKV